MAENVTVWLDNLDGTPLIRLTWMGLVESGDVRDAFMDLSSYLDSTRRPVYIVIDLQYNPRVPIPETLTYALAGPVQHDMVRDWIMVGNSPATRQIARMLVRVTGQTNILWFGSESQALDHIQKCNVGASVPAEEPLL